MHPSAWKVNSASFALTEFSEVRSRNSHLAYKLAHLGLRKMAIWGSGYLPDPPSAVIIKRGLDPSIQHCGRRAKGPQVMGANPGDGPASRTFSS